MSEAKRYTAEESDSGAWRVMDEDLRDGGPTEVCIATGDSDPFTAALRRFAYWCADRAVRVHTVAMLRLAGDAASLRHADILAGLPEIVDVATANAACDAANAAARYPAGAAKWAPAGAPAGAAAWAAAMDAEWSAAMAGAMETAWTWDAAVAAERDTHRARLLEMIEEAWNA